MEDWRPSGDRLVLISADGSTPSSDTQQLFQFLHRPLHREQLHVAVQEIKPSKCVFALHTSAYTGSDPPQQTPVSTNGKEYNKIHVLKNCICLKKNLPVMSVLPHHHAKEADRTWRFLLFLRAVAHNFRGLNQRSEAK